MPDESRRVSVVGVVDVRFVCACVGYQPEWRSETACESCPCCVPRC